jgi:L-ascorbate metabolism protein UlaG (beta-lactamase superfamily)
MKITHYLYNTFVVESSDIKIVIDPGALFFYFFQFTSLLPETEWESITHILVTHGDPDHYWHTDRVAVASGAPVVCNTTMVKHIQGKERVLGPRDRGLAFTTAFENLHPLSVGETIGLDGMSISGIKTTHGALTFRFGPLSKTITPGPEERIGWGAIGFHIQVDGRTVVNLGDTLLHADEWASIQNPDVLMVPIGGRATHNTMDEQEAVQAVGIMRPQHVIPCHYNCPAFFTRKYNPADDEMFKAEVEKQGAACIILHQGESVEI